MVEFHYPRCSSSGLRLWVECMEGPQTGYLRVVFDHKSIPKAPIGGLMGNCLCVICPVPMYVCMFLCIDVCMYACMYKVFYVCIMDV